MDGKPHASFFVTLTDAVSFGMGTPTNIGAWLLMVAVWILLFGTGVLTDRTALLPSWFTSNAFNFPLNTVTTLAELYIGFLVAAAANRGERANKEQIRYLLSVVTKMDQVLVHLVGDQQTELQEQSEILDVERSTASLATDMRTLLTENTQITQETHELAREIHTLVTTVAGNVQT